MASIYLNFDGEVTPKEANLLAQELQAYLESNASAQVDIIKEKDNTMDFGATLAIILGSTTAVALAKGIADWLGKRKSSTITIKTATGELVAGNVSSADIAVLTKSFETLANANRKG